MRVRFPTRKFNKRKAVRRTEYFIGPLTLTLASRLAVAVSAPQGISAQVSAQPGVMDGSLYVQVTDQLTQQPLQGASVRLPDLDLSASTGPDGGALMTSIPPGDRRVSITMLGYGEAQLTIEFTAGSVARVDVPLAAQPVMLEGIVVTYTPLEGWSLRLEQTGFYQRRTVGIGRFVDRLDIDEARPLLVSDLFRRMSGVTLVQVEMGRYAVVNRRGFPGFQRGPSGLGTSSMACAMQVFVDHVLSNTNGRIDDLPPEVIDGIEVYNGVGQIPPQYNRGPNASCGVIVIWTRR
jgi:hypothetical protein